MRKTETNEIETSPPAATKVEFLELGKDFWLHGACNGWPQEWENVLSEARRIVQQGDTMVDCGNGVEEM